MLCCASGLSVYRQQISQFFPRTRYSTPIGPVKYCLSVPDSGLLEQHAFHWASMCILWPNCVGQYMHRSIVSVMSALNSVYVTVHQFYWLYIAICQAYFWFWSMCIYIKYIVYSIQLHKRLDDKCIFAYFFIDTKKQAKQLTGWYDI